MLEFLKHFYLFIEPITTWFRNKLSLWILIAILSFFDIIIFVIFSITFVPIIMLVVFITVIIPIMSTCFMTRWEKDKYKVDFYHDLVIKILKDRWKKTNPERFGDNLKEE